MLLTAAVIHATHSQTKQNSSTAKISTTTDFFMLINLIYDEATDGRSISLQVQIILLTQFKHMMFK
ncbi:hypothetical protein BCU91_14020 [Shewanella sp. 10N.286.52.B9]|nr:hypothetical protein BCU91_14020 [Shewanella sp. 10N.286.52.B9]